MGWVALSEGYNTDRMKGRLQVIRRALKVCKEQNKEVYYDKLVAEIMENLDVSERKAKEYLKFLVNIGNAYTYTTEDPENPTKKVKFIRWSGEITQEKIDVQA